MTDSEIKALRAAAEKATPGPWNIDWHICRADHSDAQHSQQEIEKALKSKAQKKPPVPLPIKAGDELWRVPASIGPICVDHDHWAGGFLSISPEDLDYIAAAHPQAVLALLDEVERLRGALEFAHDALAFASIPGPGCDDARDCRDAVKMARTALEAHA